MHRDKFKINTIGLKTPESKDTEVQKALSNGEKVFYDDKGIYVFRNNTKVYLEE